MSLKSFLKIKILTSDIKLKKNYINLIDYGVGNIFSISKSLEHLNFKCNFVKKPSDLIENEKIILPGVGSFPNCKKLLKKNQLDKLLIRESKKGTPLLGVCIGMQLLMDYSLEIKKTKGLGLVGGFVKKISNDKINKVPNIGWRNVTFKKKFFANKKNFFYFVHSYKIQLDDKGFQTSYIKYGKNIIPTSIQKKNIFGCQFHPEKSGKDGINFLKKFLDE